MSFNNMATNLGELLLVAAKDSPNSICMETVDGCWTFSQVAAMAGSIRIVLRHALQKAVTSAGSAEGNLVSPPAHSRHPDEHVVITALERGVEALACVHAIMLERCAYNCFDVAEHREKLMSWVEVAQPAVLMSSPDVVARLGLEAGCFHPHSPVLIDVRTAIQRWHSHNEEVKLLSEPTHRPEDLTRLAYLIFTSGSTGKPKAVMIQHQSAMNVARIWSQRVGLRAGDRHAQIASMSWDPHVLEIYGSISARASIVCVPDHIKKSGPDMLSFLRHKRITGMNAAPTHLRMISSGGEANVSCSPEGLPDLRLLESGGEALGQDVIRAWAPDRQMWNAYGPSEISVICCSALVEPGTEISIGTELPSYNCHVLHPETLEPVAPGERGVLYIGGVGLARGYLDEAEKTAAKFQEIEGKGRLYNSGDLASRGANGHIYFHGRVDWQVKVRGIRIELEALEQELARLPAVKHCEARAFDGNQRLAVIISGSKDLSEELIKSTAAALGKGYVLNLVQFVEDSAWKFNTSNKLVRNHIALEDGGSSVLQQACNAWACFDQSGATDLELRVAKCLAPKVRTTSWNRHSHFLEDLGVDSAGFTQLVTLLRAEAEFQCVTVVMLLANPSVSKLATHMSTVWAQTEELGDPWEETMQGEPTMLDLFLESASRTPFAPCCEEDGSSWTYQQVLQGALAAQHHLRKALRCKKQKPPSNLDEPADEPAVAILLSGASLVTSMLGCLLEGYAICVLDGSMKHSDIVARLHLLSPVAIVSDAEHIAALESHEACKTRTWEFVDVKDIRTSELVGRLKPQVTGNRLCAITFTEEDQQLRAALTEHGSAHAAVLEWCQLTQACPRDRCLMMFPASEAAGMIGLWCAFAAGATLLMPPSPQLSRSSRMCVHWLHEKRATMLGCTAAHLKAIEGTQEAISGALTASKLRLVWVLSNPSASAEPVIPWASRGVQTLNAHCRPEAWSLAGMSATSSGSSSHSQELKGCCLQVLDSSLQPVHENTTGTLCLSGAGVARGYLGDHEADARFHLVGSIGHVFNTRQAAMQCAGKIELTEELPRWTAAIRQFSMGSSLRRSKSLLSSQPTLSNFMFSMPAKATAKTYDYGEGSYPRLCKVVQGLIIVSEPVGMAFMFLLGERLFLPLGLNSSYLGPVTLFVGIMQFLLFSQLLSVLLLIAAKWVIVGRYREGNHAIYSLFYLRHWIVERLAKNTPLSTAWVKVPDLQAPFAMPTSLGISVGPNLVKNLLLKALGADVSLSAVVAAPVVGYDLLHVGPMATVHGPNHLSAISFAGRRMNLATQKVGAGAYVGPRSCLEPGSEVAEGGYVEPLSTVPSGMTVIGRVSGVPAKPVDTQFPSKARELQPRASCSFVFWSSIWALFSWLMIVPKALEPFFTLLIFKFMAGNVAPHGFSLDFPPAFFDNLWWFPILAFAGSIVHTCLTFVFTIVVCRLVPKARPPLDVSLTSVKARMIAFKVALVSQMSNMLNDASMQAALLRLCGADVGKGTFISDIQALPETLTVRDDCFIATDNIVTSVNLDQGRLLLPSHTTLEARTFLGNRNHIVEGLPEESLAGFNTWLPAKPSEGKLSYFGNPAVSFSRPTQQVAKPSKEMKMWFHFGSSIINVFFWKATKSASVAFTFCVGRTLFPSLTAIWQAWVLLGLYFAMPLAFWYIFGVRIPNMLHNDRVPKLQGMYSHSVLRYMNAQSAMKIFVAPVKTAGSAWQGALLWLKGAKIGRDFFSTSEDVLWDPCFSRIGDYVTMDYDVTVTMHSAEDFQMKFAEQEIADGAILMQGCTLASADVGCGAILRPGSVTWKGQILEPDCSYEGVPAEELDVDLETGLQP